MNKPYYCDYAGVPTIVGDTALGRLWKVRGKKLIALTPTPRRDLLASMNSDTFLVDCHHCPRQFRADECPLLAQSGHTELQRTCPLSGVKRT